MSLHHKGKKPRQWISDLRMSSAGMPNGEAGCYTVKLPFLISRWKSGCHYIQPNIPQLSFLIACFPTEQCDWKVRFSLFCSPKFSALC